MCRHSRLHKESRTMNVIDLIQRHKGTAFSFEVLPPLKGTGTERLFHTIDTLRDFSPAYINITNHRSEYVYRDLAGGTVERLRIRRRPGTAHLIVLGTSLLKYENPVFP